MRETDILNTDIFTLLYVTLPLNMHIYISDAYISYDVHVGAEYNGLVNLYRSICCMYLIHTYKHTHLTPTQNTLPYPYKYIYIFTYIYIHSATRGFCHFLLMFADGCLLGLFYSGLAMGSAFLDKSRTEELLLY